MAELVEEQMGLAVEVMEMIESHIGDPPVGRESYEEAERRMERLQRELDEEKNRREQEGQ